MELRQIADAIGIGTYMPELDHTYASVSKTDAPACDLEVIDKLQADYNTFGEFYELVRAVGIQINGDKTAASGSKLPLPTQKTTPASWSTVSPCLNLTAQLSPHCYRCTF